MKRKKQRLVEPVTNAPAIFVFATVVPLLCLSVLSGLAVKVSLTALKPHVSLTPQPLVCTLSPLCLHRGI